MPLPPGARRTVDPRIALADSRCGAFEVVRQNNVSTAAQVTNAAVGMKNAMAGLTTRIAQSLSRVQAAMGTPPVHQRIRQRSG